MVGFCQSTAVEETTKEEKRDLETQSLSDLKKPSTANDRLDLCIPEIEDFSVSFSDSFLDFDSINGWLMEGSTGDPVMDDLVGNPVGFGMVGREFGDSKEKLEACGDAICERDEVKEELAGNEASKLNLKLEKDEIAFEERSVEMASEEVSEKVNEKGVLGGEGCSSDLGGLGCLIEEQLGKVSLGGGVKKMDESVGDEESESESSSASSAASSSSSSSSSDEEDEDEDLGGTSQEKKSKKGGVSLDEHADMEDGEIMLSDTDEMVAWGDDEDGIGSGPIKSKNELKVLPPVPSVGVTLELHHQTLPVGVILSIVGAQVIVEGVEKHNPLNEGSILWITDSRSPLGLIDEIFGPVKNPYYIVRYNSESEVPAGIQPGTLISFVAEYADHVLNDKNLYQKGYDASGDNDEELSEELEFSDDEKEAEYKRMLKMNKRGTNESNPGNKRKDKRQPKNQKGNWNRNQDQKLPVITEDQQFNPPVGTSLNQDHQSMVPPFPQGPQVPQFPAPHGIWNNRFPHPQQQGMNLPTGLPADGGMMWMQQNLPYPLFQTNPALLQQIGMIPGLPINFNGIGAQPNLSGGPSLAPWQMGLDQNALNQLQFGMGMGLPGQHATLPSNAGGEQAAQSQGSQNLNFNQGHGGRGGGGRRSHHRGRGRHGGGRGRQP